MCFLLSEIKYKVPYEMFIVEIDISQHIFLNCCKRIGERFPGNLVSSKTIIGRSNKKLFSR